MADETLAFSVKIDGVDRAINSFKDLKQAKKDATEAFLRGDKDAAKALADLKDKTEDLTDATQTLKGSGVEKINASFSQLSEGFKNFDTEKIKIGFKGIGAAMSAIPLILLIEGVKALIENFDTVVKFAKELTGAFSAAEKNVRALTKSSEENLVVNKNLIASYDSQIALLTAQGASEKDIIEIKKKKIQVQIAEAEDIVRLNSAKAAEILLNDSVSDSIQRVTISYMRKIGQDEAADKLEAAIAFSKKERIKEELKAIQDAQIGIQASKTALLVLDIEYNKKIEEENNKRYLATQKRLDDELAAKNDAFTKELDAKIKSDEMIAAYEAEQKALKASQKEEEDAAFLEQARLQSEEVQAIAYNESDLKKQLREQELESFKENYQAQLNTAQSLTTSLSSLSDSYFYFKRKNLEKGSAEDLKQAKKQFDINKGLAIASATISGIQGVVNALSAQSIIPEPYGTVLKVVTAAAVGAAAVANIAKIASSKFDAGGGGGAGGGASAAAPMPIPAPPTINTPTANTNAGSTFDETGKRIGGESERTMNPTIIVKANIGVDEVSNKQNRVDTLEKQSTF